MREYVTAYIALVYLNVLDALLTMFHLRNGANELNPLVAGLITDFGVSGILIIKLIVLAVLGIIVVRMTLQNTVTKYAGLIDFVTAVYAGVVLYSVALLP
jgi:carbon starvation protein CstA